MGGGNAKKVRGEGKEAMASVEPGGLVKVGQVGLIIIPSG